MGHDPVAFVVRLNLRRRHLSETQRAWVAAKITNLSHGVRSDTSIEGSAVTTDRAAKLLNVGRASVERARLVRDRRELLSFRKWLPLTKCPSRPQMLPVFSVPEQREIVAKGNEEIKKAVKRERKSGPERRSAPKLTATTTGHHDAIAKPEPQPEPNVSGEGRKRLQRSWPKKMSGKDERKTASRPRTPEARSGCIGIVVENYDQPTDKACEAAEWFDIDERGGAGWIRPGICRGNRTAAEHLKALADNLEGRGLSQEPVYDDDDAADDGGSAIPKNPNRDRQARPSSKPAGAGAHEQSDVPRRESAPWLRLCSPPSSGCRFFGPRSISSVRKRSANVLSTILKCQGIDYRQMRASLRPDLPAAESASTMTNRLFDMDDELGEPALIVAVHATDAETVIDLVGWPIRRPEAVWHVCSVMPAVLGRRRGCQSGIFCRMRRARSGRRPWHGCRADLRGCVVLDPRLAAPILRQAPGSFQCEDVDQAQWLVDTGAIAVSELLVPARRAVA